MKISTETKEYRDNLLTRHIAYSTGILHLGAHLGQEAARYHQLGKPVVWVEANPSIFRELIKRLEVFPNQKAHCALLDRENGLQRKFKISNNMRGVSSSIFDFDEYGNGQNTLWPDLHLQMISEVILTTTNLDTLLNNSSIKYQDFDFWVIDLQGAELLALQGAEQTLKSCNSLCVEISEVPVYCGGVLWKELHPWLEQRGFTPLWSPEIAHDNILFIRK